MMRNQLDGGGGKEADLKFSCVADETAMDVGHLITLIQTDVKLVQLVLQLLMLQEWQLLPHLQEISARLRVMKSKRCSTFLRY